MSTDDWHPPATTILIVTGSTLRAEDADRPLAYFVREQILNRSSTDDILLVHVVSDYRYLNDRKFAELPTISVGGPGVNALSQKWLECVPFILIVEDEFFLQMDCNWPARSSVWGVDHETTRLAVSTFVDGHLDAFLSFCRQRNPQP
jgi:hypothetical protein